MAHYVTTFKCGYMRNTLANPALCHAMHPVDAAALMRAAFATTSSDCIEPDEGLEAERLMYGSRDSFRESVSTGPGFDHGYFRHYVWKEGEHRGKPR